MKEFTCKCYGEEFTANLYEIVVKQQTGIPVFVLQQEQWVSAEQIQSVQDLLKWGQDQGLRGRNGVGYSGDDIIGFLEPFLLICAIGSNPNGNHMVQPQNSTMWVNWTQNKKIYELVCTNAKLQNDFPDYDSSNPLANSISPNHWIPYNSSYIEKHDGLRVASSLGMTLKGSFPKQIRAQIPFTGSIRGILRCTGSLSKYTFDHELKKILTYLQKQIIKTGECYLPYIGAFVLRGNRLCFSSSRILKDRLKGKEAPLQRKNAGRIYGGEKSPGQSIIFWCHNEKLSRRRKFIKGFCGERGNLAVSNIAYQAFVDSFFFRLSQDIKIVLQGIGTVRISESKQISFRTSKTFRNVLQQTQDT